MMIDNQRKQAVRDLRIIFFGMLGDLSTIPLLTLLDAGMPVAAVVVPASVWPSQGHSGDAPIMRIEPEPQPSQLPLLNPYVTPNPLLLAWQRQIPALAAARLDAPETLATLAGLDPDLICVSCFSQRFPKALRELPRYGCLNLHPSLLPDFRGPAPLFWTFRRGQSNTGVTVHFMDEGLDTGDIALQASLMLPDGISGAAAERLCAGRGSELLVKAVQALARGEVTRRPQPPGGSTHPWPAAADFTLDTRWPACRAFNFMRGTAEWGRSYPVIVAGNELQLATPVAYTADTTLREPAIRQGKDVFIRFTPGVLQARPA